MKTLKYVAVAAIITLGFTACEEEASIKIEQCEEIPTILPTPYNLQMQDFTMAVQNAMNKSHDFRQLVRETNFEMFDGDYNVLLKQLLKPNDVVNESEMGVKSKIVAKIGLPVKALLEEYYNQGISAKSTNSTQIGSSPIDKLLEEHPNVQIALRGNCESWDGEETPIVTFIPDDYQDGITQRVIGWKPNGDTIILDAVKEPKFPVIVIGENERIERYLGESPKTPSNLVANVSAKGVGLSWNKVGNPSLNSYFVYEIYRKSAHETSFSQIGSTYGVDDVVFFDRTTQAGVLYYYYIVAKNIVGASNPSNMVSIQGVRPAAINEFTADVLTNTQAELRWNTENSDYEQVEISKMVVGNDPDYLLFNTFDNNKFYCFDNSIISGKKILYQARTKAAGLSYSAPKYDFIQVPYRNPSYPSAVRIKQINCNLKAIEGWLRGKPEFLIKVYTLNRETGEAREMHSEITCKFSKRQSACSFNSFVLDWRPEYWYDILSFHVVEDDNNANWEYTITIQTDSKGTTDGKDSSLSGGLSLGLEAKYDNKNIEFSAKGNDCGSGYLHYLDPVGKIVEFPNYDVKLTFGQ